MAYHKADNAVYLFGGMDESRTLLDEFWKWNGSGWQQLHIQPGPSMRASHDAAYAKNAFIIYGGVTKTGLTNELWEFSNGQWKMVK
jgi:hypothetical protein